MLKAMNAGSGFVRFFTTRSLTRFLRDNGGASAVEFAMVAPLFIALLMGLLDFGTAAFRKLELSAAARAGAQYAIENSFDKFGIELAAKEATGFDGDISVNSDAFCACGGARVSCSTTCDNGEFNQRFVTVEVSETYNPIFLPKPEAEMKHTQMNSFQKATHLNSNVTVRIR